MATENTQQIEAEGRAACTTILEGIQQRDPIIHEEPVETTLLNVRRFTRDGITEEMDAAEAERRRHPIMPDRPPTNRNDLSAIDDISCEALTTCNFKLIEDIPPNLTETWACIMRDIFEGYETAVAQGDAVNRDRALKWWLSIHTMILRTPVKGRGGRRSNDNPAGRMEYWRQGNFTAIVEMWKKASQKAMKANGKPLLPKSEEDKELERQEKAVEFLERKCFLKHAAGRFQKESEI